MCQWGIEINCFVGNLQLLVPRHAVEGTHVVKAIGKLNQNHTHIFGKREEHLPEVLSLLRCAVFKYTSDLCETIDDLRDLFAEHAVDVCQLNVGVFDHIMHQRRNYRSGSKSDLFDCNLGNGQGMKNEGLA